MQTLSTLTSLSQRMLYIQILECLLSRSLIFTKVECSECESKRVYTPYVLIRYLSVCRIAQANY